MIFKQKLENLAKEKSAPCVTISLNTHRTHPDNAQDAVLLKNLLSEAEERVIAEFGKKTVAPLLEKIKNVANEIDTNYNLDSLHLFLSNDTKEIVKSAWCTGSEGVQISENFALRSIIKLYTRSEGYFIMLLSQSGAQLYEALNEEILQEIKNNEFPFEENPYFEPESVRRSDSKHVDNLVREYLNKIDKALIKIHNETGLNCVVICTENNYSLLQQVAQKPSVYLGYAAVDYNNTATHKLVKQSWEIIKSQQKELRNKAIIEVKDALSQGKVLTDLQEIYQAALDGRGDLLIICQDFSQSVLMTGERTFELADNTTQHEAIDDITSDIAWEVISKKGRVYFTSQEEIMDFGKIVLKTRY